MHLELYACPPRGARAIPLRRRDGSTRTFTWVDEDDYEQANFISWSLHPHGYVTRTVGPKNNQYTFRLHRLILGLRDDDPRQPDHRNGNRKDNRRCNLRAVLEKHNHQNLRPRKDGTSKYRGVRYDRRRDNWVAEAQVEFKRFYIGAFKTEFEAHQAAVEFRREHMPFSEEAA
jgi:hypothetical protein